MWDADKKSFQNGNDLLECCVRKLNESQHGKTGGNVALYPTVIIFMGKKSRDYVRHIKNTLDDNWNNARYLQYLSVYKNGNEWKCIPLKETREYDKCQWQDESSSEDFEDLLNKSIVKLLETDEKIFAKRTRVKIEFVLDATERDNIQYYELYRDINSSLHTNDLKTLYLMIDQKPSENKALNSDAVLQHIIVDPQRKQLTVYLISNYLESGVMLSEQKIWQNYRLAADIILLGGNRTGVSTHADNLYNGLKTVSYALVTKPTDEIAAISLQALLAGVYEAEESASNLDLGEKEIRQKLEMDDYNGVKLAEEIFRKEIASSFPDKEAFRYLPFKSERAYKEAMKAEKITVKGLDAVTMNAASCYIEQHYIKKVIRFVEGEEDEIRRRIRRQLKDVFRYFELRKLDKIRLEIKKIIRSDYYFSGSGKDDFCGLLQKEAVYMAKKLYYDKIKEIMAEEVEKLVNASLQFEELYRECEEEVQRERIITGDESESVEKTYRNIVKDFIQERYSKEAGFQEIFSVDVDKNSLLAAIWKAFLDLIQKEVYRYDFEKEVDSRIDRMNDEERHIFVSRELKKKLDGSIRLKNPVKVSMMKTSCFYMVNEKAEYAKNLKNAEGKDREYLLFNLNRTDCIEQIEIYDILSPEDIHLVFME